MERHFYRTVLVVVLGVFTLSCIAQPDAPLTREDAEKNPQTVVVATVQDDTFTLADITAAIAHRGPLAQERYQAPQAKQAFLQSFVDFEVLSREGLRRGHLQSPVVQRAYRSALAATLWEKGALPGADRALLTEERVRAYFEAHRGEFTEPETAKVSHLLVKLPDAAPLESRRRAMEKARALLADLGERADAARFADFARRLSDDDATKAKGGELGLVVKGTDDGDLPSELIEAAFATPAGQVRLVATSSGVHLLRVDARFSGRLAVFESVRKKVEARVWLALRRDAMRRLLVSLREKARVERLATPRLQPLPEKPKADGGADPADVRGPVMQP